MPLAERDSHSAPTSPATSWQPVQEHVGWESALLLAAVYAAVVVGVAFLARKLGLRRGLSWTFAIGVGSWVAAPFAADSAAGGLLAAAGLLLMPGAVAAEVVLRRRVRGIV